MKLITAMGLGCIVMFVGLSIAMENPRYAANIRGVMGLVATRPPARV